MDERLQFSGREEFRGWLQDHCRTDGGIWLLFGKAGGPRTDHGGGGAGGGALLWLDRRTDAAD